MHVKADSDWDPRRAPSFWINHASRLLMRQFEQALRPLEFGMAYLPVVMALKEEDGLLQRDLADRSHVEQPTMAALIARMERDGLVSRGPHPTDKRSSQISLTAKAKTRLPAARRALEEIADRATTGFTERERATFLSLLKRVVKNLGETGEIE